jgi:short-subunit dehydrogenase
MKTIVLTGSTSGIGELILKGFLKKGYKVFAGYRNEAHKEKLQELSVNVVPFYIDMTKKETITAAAEFIISETDKIDTLVNVAGCVVAGAMECLNVDKIREQFEVNTFSHLEFTQGLFSKLGGGRIINISSEASFGIFPFIAPYCASKRALDILFNSMQIECGGKCGGDIKIISIKPGVIKTPLWDKSIENNQNVLGENKKYEKEFNFLMENAKKNNYRGLEPQKVADFIIEISELKKPKTSYTIGIDSKLTEIFSHLPQGWINFIIKKTLKKRCKV